MIDHECPNCGGRLDRKENTAKHLFCRQCGEVAHEAVIQATGDLQLLAQRGDTVGQYARTLLETGGVA